MGHLSGAAVGILLVAVLAATGCRTASSSPDRVRVQQLRPGDTIDTRALDLTEEEERLVEAHARFTAGLIEEMEESPETAVAHYQAAVANDPGNETLALDTSRKLIELARLDEARQILERAVARTNASGAAWGWLGLVHVLQKNRPAAIAANEEAIRRLPTGIAAYQMLARIYFEGGQIDEALAVLETAATQPGVDASFLIVLADSLSVLQQMKDPSMGDLRTRILALLDRAASLEPTEPAQVLRLADLYQRFGAGTKSLPLYERLLESQPDLPGLRERLTEIYLRLDDRAKAAEQLTILARKQPTNPLPHYFLGVLALEAKQYEDAAAAFQKVLLLRPDNEGIYFDLAIAHLSHRRPQEALAVLDQARAKFRSSFRLEFYSAAALLDLKRYEDAIRHFTAAEVIAGATSPENLTALFYFQSGVGYERAKRFDDASVQFEKAIELEPDFADALNYLGYMWAEQGLNLERALELIQKAVKLEPENDAFLDSLAWVLHQLGRSEEALPHQLKAIELAKEPDATLFEHLGDIYQRLGRRDEARKAWKRAQEIEPKPEVETKLRESETGG